jgi:ribosomal protein uS17
METLEVLEDMLGEYQGTVLLISHDRDFLDRLVSGVIVPEGGGQWAEYAGGYSDMLVQRGADLVREQLGPQQRKATREPTPTVAEAPAAEKATEEAPAEEEATESVAEVAAEDTVDEKVPSEPAAPAPQSGPKLKKKRLPRSLRPKKTRPTREKATERKPIVRLEKPEHERGRSQERLGTVVSDAMDKTIVVKVDVIKSHRKYKKVVRRSVKFHAHDETNSAHVGDTVRIVETHPLSATKRWRLTEIVEVAK